MLHAPRPSVPYNEKHMITWFDALLVTLLAAVTVMGARRGLAGAVWGVVALMAWLLVNLFSPLPLLALVLALAAGYGAAWLARSAVPGGVSEVWHLGVGAVGGLALGVMVVCALALSFPIRSIGSNRTYPSSNLPPALYYAVYNSFAASHLTGLWSGNRVARLFLAPDRNK